MPDLHLPPVLLLHGVCSTGETMGALADAFRDRGCRVAAPTLAPQRRTDAGALDGSLANLTLSVLLEEARDHARAMTTEFGEKPLVVGHSNGALLALALAGMGAVGAVGLAAPAPPPSVPGAPLWLRRLLFSRLFGTGWETRAIRFRPGWPFREEMPGMDLARTLCPDSGPAMAEALAPARGGPFDPTPPLQCPAVVVAGSKDKMVPIALTRSLAQSFGAAHRTIDGAGHWLIGERAHGRAISTAILETLNEKA
ncbi:alpha/beta fold hydrolase [Roseibacterium sp. SDUM158017]|uniref:alpha/beta fold hydrolase n=1 Tax=Roseicyclus salinarum TaxID=3036773 RepID=UPI0024151619|nr:alpha/beta fold hydrolase [Roseibacterium sp. SDUM158017]MDG4650367.1 alpha/beta fold hydrolase [Roseibacterium sp. SDUM158017]